MQTSSSARIGAIVSLAGVALIILGFFLPMFISGLRYSSTGHPTYEWELLRGEGSRFFSLPMWGSLLGALIVLGTSVTACFRVLSPGLLRLWRVAALAGLFLQLLLDVLALPWAWWSYFGVGFFLVPIGFALTAIAAFLGRTSRAEV